MKWKLVSDWKRLTSVCLTAMSAGVLGLAGLGGAGWLDGFVSDSTPEFRSKPQSTAPYTSSRTTTLPRDKSTVYVFLIADESQRPTLENYVSLLAYENVLMGTQDWTFYSVVLDRDFLDLGDLSLRGTQDTVAAWAGTTGTAYVIDAREDGPWLRAVP